MRYHRQPIFTVSKLWSLEAKIRVDRVKSSEAHAGSLLHVSQLLQFHRKSSCNGVCPSPDARFPLQGPSVCNSSFICPLFPHPPIFLRTQSFQMIPWQVWAQNPIHHYFIVDSSALQRPLQLGYMAFGGRRD